jgi:hypothetical protein
VGGPALEAHPVVHPAGTQGQQAQANAVGESQGREVEQIPGRGELEEVVGVIHPGIGRVDLDPTVEAQLTDQLHDLQVIGEPVVVEAVELLAAHIECRCQPADLAFRFEHGDRNATGCEFVGGRQAGEAATDNGCPAGVVEGHGQDALASCEVRVGFRRR